jgi:hypothetical protein
MHRSSTVSVMIGMIVAATTLSSCVNLVQSAWYCAS